MDKFKNRIRYFAVGLLFGTILVYFMFGNRGCAWLPENRVKNMVGEKEIIVGDSVLEVMECWGITNDDIYALLKDEGEVEFSLSKTEGVPKIYYIESEKDAKLYWAKFALYEEKELAEVTEVFYDNGQQCSSTVSNKYSSTLPLPHNDVVAILESNEFRILEDAECEMEFYHIKKEDLLKFHHTASVDIRQSNPRKSPNPEYVMRGELNGENFGVRYIIGDNRTRIDSIFGAVPTDCLSDM